MPNIPMGWRLMAAAVVVSLLPGIASAQEVRPNLKYPTIAASIAAAADWASTYHALSNYHVREQNVLLQQLQGSPGKLITAGAAIDAATFSAWNLTMGRKHPRVAATGMWAMAAFRTALVLHNLHNETKALRKIR